MNDQLPYTDLLVDPLSKVKYRCHLPQAQAPKRLLILLHGVGSNETHVRHLAKGQDADTLVLLTQGPLQLGAAQFAWFRVNFTPEGPKINVQETEQARQVLSTFVKSVQAQFKIRPQETLIAGFSQGGIMSASLALTQPALVRGFAVLSGRILPEISPFIAPKNELAHLHGFIAHGEHDQTLLPMWAKKADECLNEHGIEHWYKTYPIAHEVSEDVKVDFTAWSKLCFGLS